MTYAPADRPFYDADSHIMELPNFLIDYADAAVRDQIRPVSYQASLVTDEEVEAIVANGSKHTTAHVERQIALGDQLIAESKEIQALGAFDRDDRSVAMDMLGFKKQLVFATHSVVTPFSASKKLSDELRYGATRAHNRAMSDFVANDPRLMGVAVIPLNNPELALLEVDFALEAGLEAVWVPHHPAGERSPSHVNLWPFWERLGDAGLPFLLHVGGAPLQLDPVWSNTGRDPVRDWMGGGENVRSKDMAVMHQGPETFLSVMLMDGIFERFPKLRGASVELGAGWVPSMLERLDWVVRSWGRVDQYLAELEQIPSDTFRQQMAFTPFAFEDIGTLTDVSYDDIYLFSSDYPHVEGGKDPIGRFEKSLGSRSEQICSNFYTENFLRIFPGARVH
ncbi:MAG: putative TIM-barrel fold metal-dependent hydrolase [Candidatus Aldehydirespiratoraceae bacterium]|jgi:predicted TIM-barrel fold metal-dependent hydrolase